MAASIVAFGKRVVLEGRIWGGDFDIFFKKISKSPLLG